MESFKRCFVLLGGLIPSLYLVMGVEITQIISFNLKYKAVYSLFDAPPFLLLKYFFNFFYIESFNIFRIYFYTLSLNLIFSFLYLLIIVKRKCLYSLSFY